MNEMKTQIRMSDIAKALGISTVTVSKALANKSGVSAALRAEVKKKAQDMGYAYSGFSRGRMGGRNYIIGIIVGGKFLGESSFYWIFYQNLLHELKKTPYLGILEVVSLEDEQNSAAPSFVLASKVDGVIVLGELSAAYLSMLTGLGVKCIFLDFYSKIGGCDCIASNNFLGAYTLTKLLIDAGHAKIAFIGSTVTTSILDRYMGFCKAVVEANLPYEKAIEDRDASSHYTEFVLDPVYTAYVCNNDRLAGHVIHQLHRLGKSVPRDVSIVGFDNEGEDLTGGIGVTSLAINISAMCALAVNQIIQNIENPAYVPHGQSFIDGKVISKASIAEPAR